MEINNDKEGWNELTDLIAEHPVEGYSTALTRTWFPNQEIVFRRGDRTVFSIKGTNFAGATVDEMSWELTIDTIDGRSMSFKLNPRKKVFSDFHEFLDFLNGDSIAIPFEAEDYASVEIFDNAICFQKPSSSKRIFIDENLFEKAQFFDDMKVIRIYLNEPIPDIIFINIPFEEN